MQRLSVLVSFIKQKKAVLFIGAGISRIAGCSSLHDICQKLIAIESVQELIKSQKPIDVPRKELIAFCKSICTKSDNDRRELDGVMREVLAKDPEKFYREYLPLIKKLKQLVPIPSIMTTNVDACLADTRLFDLSKIYYKMADMRMKLFRDSGIFHIHGYIEDSCSQLWDLHDYPKRYEDQEFKNFIKEIFREYSVLFLGYAFGDDDELRHLIFEAKKENSEFPMHFALLPTDEVDSHVNDVIYEELYNIHVIKYGLRTDFLKLFGEWIDSNFNPVTIGNDEQISYPSPNP